MQKTRNIWSSVPSTDYVDDVMQENPGMKLPNDILKALAPYKGCLHWVDSKADYR